MQRREPDARALEDAVAQVRELIAHLRKTTADLSGARLEASLPDFTDDVLFDDN